MKPTTVWVDATDEIDRLTVENARLREALESIIEHIETGGQTAGCLLIARTAAKETKT